ncbi:MAG: DUF1638 domain-containing protein [Acidobacteriota bacterium]|nr:MAG: DUF1638 domain-containing protein [Acidobacteriota bacterium]
MRIKCIACEVFARPVYACASLSGNIVDVELVEKSLHNEPANLRDILQERIDAVDSDRYDVIVLAYGLCGKSTAGLRARELPLVLPRAHDCITLYLGSRDRYQEEFEREPGTFWYVQDYVERDGGKASGLSMGAGFDADLTALRKEYVEKYGEDNADYLLEVMGGWLTHYRRAAFIDLEVGDSCHAETLARKEAESRGWQFEKITGNLDLLHRLIEADWNEDFLTVQPGSEVSTTTDELIIMAEPSSTST